MSDEKDSAKPAPRGSDILAARTLQRLLERRGAKVPAWVHNLANTVIPRPQTGDTEVQFRIMRRDGEAETQHLDFLLGDDAGLRKIMERHRDDATLAKFYPGENQTLPDDMWIERREVTVTEWQRQD